MLNNHINLPELEVHSHSPSAVCILEIFSYFSPALMQNTLFVISAASTDQTGGSTHPGKPGCDPSYSNSAAFQPEPQQRHELAHCLLGLRGPSTGGSCTRPLHGRQRHMPTLAWNRNLGEI